MSYQLDDPGIVANTKQTLHLELCRNVPMWVHWGQLRICRADLRGFGYEIGHSLKFALHEIRAKMGVAIDHLVATVTDPLLNHTDRRSSHDQSADSVMPESVHTAPFQTEPTKDGVKVLIDDDAIKTYS